jgi:nitroreductase
MDVIDIIKKRVSAHNFDTKKSVSEAEIKELIAIATEAPSSYNVQNWRIVAVTTPEAKEKLKAAAYGQQKVADAAVTFVILGDMEPYKHFKGIWQPLVDAGKMTAEQLTGLVATVEGVYSHAENSKNEAFRSAGLLGMTLMLAAEGKGLTSCPMGGFVPEQVNEALNIPKRYFPALLVTVGYEAPGNFPRKPRLAQTDVLAFNSGEHFPA